MSEFSNSSNNNQTMYRSSRAGSVVVYLLYLAALLIILLILVKAGAELFSVARDFGKFSLKWRWAFVGYFCASSVIFLTLFVHVWWPRKITRLIQHLSYWRERAGWLRWLAVAVVLILPIWFLQYTHWGNEFSGSYIHLLLYLGSAGIAGVLVTAGEKINGRVRLLSFSGLLTGLLLSGTIFVLANGFLGVTDYPLSLSWSEGNRIWDYSILFGRHLYDYPADRPIQPFIDRGRQLLWGLPFLIPGLTIFQFRLYNAVISTIPYALFGWAVFKRSPRMTWLWALAGFWTLIFLRQGPIYTPLVLSAILVAIGWRRSVWIGVPLVALAGYYANLSRVTWIFAPALWAGMMVFAETAQKITVDDIQKRHWPWGKAILFGLAGFVGGFFIPNLTVLVDMALLRLKRSSTKIDLLLLLGVILLICLYLIWKRYRHLGIWRLVFIILPVLAILAIIAVLTTFFSEYFATGLTDQSLLWDRLWSTPTNPLGILPALLIAVGPLVGLLLYWLWKWYWRPDWLRIATILAPLLAFLGVGLIASVKMGGGNNLHNLDMFLLGLVFVAALAWWVGIDHWIIQLDQRPIDGSTSFPRLLLLLVVISPAIQQVLELKPLDLADVDKVNNAISKVVANVDRAKQQGEVLFMDQRQLLTFGYVKDVPLVPDYEKKFLMDRAMSNDAAYFEQFYKDLANHRFTLIVSELLKVKYNVEKDSDYGFGEENDLWVKWVADPVLRYYQPIETFKNRRLQLLVPITEDNISP
jgi:hypothetical protein